MALTSTKLGCPTLCKKRLRLETKEMKMRYSMIMVGAASALLTLAAPAVATTTVVAETDSSWTVTRPDDTTSGAQVVTSVPASWGSPVPGTSWISTNTTGRNTTPGPYTFTKLFDLTDAASFNFLTATWKSDNYVTNVFLNGISLGSFGTTNEFGNVGPFTRTFNLAAVGASFLNTGNTLKVVVQQRDLGNNNRGNDMGLSGRFVASVPEPGTWMLMILGLGAVGFAMRRRTKAAVRFQFA